MSKHSAASKLDPNAVIAFTQLRIDLESILEGRMAPEQISALAQGLAQFVLDVRIVRIGFGYAAQMQQRPFRIAFFPQGDAQIHVRRQVIRFQRQRFLESLDRRGTIPATRQRGT